MKLPGVFVSTKSVVIPSPAKYSVCGYRYQLRRNGVEIIYVSEGFNGDDTDDLLRPVKQWQARQELKDLSKVTIRSLLSRADGGWWMVDGRHTTIWI